MWGKVRTSLAFGRYRKPIGILVLAVTGALTGLLLSPGKEVSAKVHIDVRVGNHAIETDEEPEKLAARLARQFLSEKLIIRAGDDQFEIQRSELGAQVDVVRLTNLLRQARNSDSPLRRVHAQTIPMYPLILPIPAELDSEKAISWIVRIKDIFDQKPINARIDLRRQEVQPSSYGALIDLYGTLDAIDNALITWQNEVEARIHEIPPQRVATSLKNLDMSTVLGEFETRYDRSYKSSDRTHNLRLAASRIDGYVLKPDQEFDFNHVVGGRTKTNGFKEAKVIANGQLAEGKGGGICQIASTLHAAVFFTGLPILTRHPHSRPSFYIKLGLDAAVAYGSLNFRFKNDLSFPIIIGMTVENGTVHAEIRGSARTRTVIFDRTIEAVFPYRKRFINDPDLPSGIRVLKQRGIPGFRVARVRQVIDETSKKKTRKEMQDTYPPTTEIWHIGSGPEVKEGFELPKNDTHPEYVVDEFLTVTYGIKTKGFKIDRNPGITGLYGWTSREGFLDEEE